MGVVFTDDGIPGTRLEVKRQLIGHRSRQIKDRRNDDQPQQEIERSATQGAGSHGTPLSSGATVPRLDPVADSQQRLSSITRPLW